MTSGPSSRDPATRGTARCGNNRFRSSGSICAWTVHAAATSKRSSDSLNNEVFELATYPVGHPHRHSVSLVPELGVESSIQVSGLRPRDGRVEHRVRRRNGRARRTDGEPLRDFGGHETIGPRSVEAVRRAVREGMTLDDAQAAAKRRRMRIKNSLWMTMALCHERAVTISYHHEVFRNALGPGPTRRRSLRLHQSDDTGNRLRSLRLHQPDDARDRRPLLVVPQWCAHRASARALTAIRQGSLRRY